ncbi:hypothetical protein GOP47_0021325 [Adiantum capillus-veneris]|uniref:Uncharacterized protein n=1 Tax=Adiantum capillus-veneris TaxID=13818 RepID=A0A9D4UB54_ADICA|nr:hypothetical protein GOP47_0021325 [Adiantum capillus-veneris]
MYAWDGCPCNCKEQGHRSFFFRGCGLPRMLFRTHIVNSKHPNLKGFCFETPSLEEKWFQNMFLVPRLAMTRLQRCMEALKFVSTLPRRKVASRTLGSAFAIDNSHD